MCPKLSLSLNRRRRKVQNIESTALPWPPLFQKGDKVNAHTGKFLDPLDNWDASETFEVVAVVKTSKQAVELSKSYEDVSTFDESLLSGGSVLYFGRWEDHQTSFLTRDMIAPQPSKVLVLDKLVFACFNGRHDSCRVNHGRWFRLKSSSDLWMQLGEATVRKMDAVQSGGWFEWGCDQKGAKGGQSADKLNTRTTPSAAVFGPAAPPSALCDDHVEYGCMGRAFVMCCKSKPKRVRNKLKPGLFSECNRLRSSTESFGSPSLSTSNSNLFGPTTLSTRLQTSFQYRVTRKWQS